MARKSSRYPTELELTILKILWRNGSSTVRQVCDALAQFRPLAMTSVTTVMNIMADKGYLQRSKQGGRYQYQPLLSEEKTSRGMMGDLVERVFDGSAATAMVNLLEASDLDDTELKEISRLIRQKAKEQNK